VLPHPPYSPDLAPSGFHLFPKLKGHLEGQRFSREVCSEETVSNTKHHFFKGGFQNLLQLWLNFNEMRGDFVEK
jgi:histone-lysine N-methyltransferase SETMAR